MSAERSYWLFGPWHCPGGLAGIRQVLGRTKSFCPGLHTHWGLGTRASTPGLLEVLQIFSKRVEHIALDVRVLAGRHNKVLEEDAQRVLRRVCETAFWENRDVCRPSGSDGSREFRGLVFGNPPRPACHTLLWRNHERVTTSLPSRTLRLRSGTCPSAWTCLTAQVLVFGGSRLHRGGGGDGNMLTHLTHRRKIMTLHWDSLSGMSCPFARLPLSVCRLGGVQLRRAAPKRAADAPRPETPRRP